MKLVRRTVTALIAASALACLTLNAPVARATTAGFACTFGRVPVQAPSGSATTDLSDVKVVSPTDAWAVGSSAGVWIRGYPGARSFPLVEHWDGSGWEPVRLPIPGPRPRSTSLTRLAVMSPTSVWAIGNEGPWPSPDREQGVLYRGNATIWWRPRLPRLGGRETFTGIDVVGPGDVWIVGSWRGPSPSLPTEPLFLHWDGRAWSVQRPALYPGDDTTTISDVTTSSSGVIAAGFAQRDGFARVNFVATLTNGSWVPTQLPSTPTNYDDDVVTLLSGDWGAGGYTDVPYDQGPTGLGETATALQLDPSGWASASTPILMFQPDDWDYVDSVWGADVLDLGPSSAWLVGNISGSPGPPGPTPFIEHWDGASWSVLGMPTRTWPTFFNAVDATSSSGTVLVVGELSKTLNEHAWRAVAYEGTCD